MICYDSSVPSESEMLYAGRQLHGITRPIRRKRLLAWRTAHVQHQYGLYNMDCNNRILLLKSN